MNKILLIGRKDLLVAFRDRAAIIFMLIAPFVLTLGLGLVTGSFSSSNSSLSGIPVDVVNQDSGQLGKQLVSVFQSKDLAELISPTILSDPAAARNAVDTDKTAAAVIIPSGFSQSILPGADGSTGPLVQIELYANPTRPTTVGVIQTILEQYLSQVEIGRISGEVTVRQLLTNGLISPQQAPALGAQVGASLAAGQGSKKILLTRSSGSSQAAPFNALAYMAPGMALMFLMYTVSNGGRMLLSEKNHGTLPRLMVSPTRASQVLGGKLFGVFLTGVVQMLILIGSCSLLFHLNWGDPLSVLVVTLAVVIGATGWGSLITAIAKTAGQVSAIGSAIMLTFGILGGSFFNIEFLPSWFKIISRITPNSWGLTCFTTLAGGGTLSDILIPIGALLGMGILLFAVSALLIRRRRLI